MEQKSTASKDVNRALSALITLPMLAPFSECLTTSPTNTKAAVDCAFG